MNRLLIISLLFIVSLGLSCTETQVKTVEELENSSEILEKGAAISASVGKTLMGTLQKQMAATGINGAIEFCNLSALGITDSLSKLHNVEIKRTALKIRNPLNKPDSLELAVLKTYKASGIYKPQVLKAANGTAYFEPITTKGLCLNCHGTKGENLSFETDSILKKHYPNDAATDFKEGDLRGMWAIYFKQ